MPHKYKPVLHLSDLYISTWLNYWRTPNKHDVKFDCHSLKPVISQEIMRNAYMNPRLCFK